MITPIKAQAFIVAIRVGNTGANTERLLRNEIFDSKCKKYWYRSKDGRLEIAYCPRSSQRFINNDSETETVKQLILGDDAEWLESFDENCMASGAFVEFDISRNYFKLITSIVGLPPLFIYRSSIFTVITSDIYLLARISSVNLHFNIQAVGDFCQIGYPISGMTLFKEVMLVPGGTSIVLESDGQLQQVTMPVFINSQEFANDWTTYLDLQTNTLRKAMRAIDISKSFFSLTAGLDTRAILAMLVAEKRFLPAYTLTGKTLTLDAMIARDLCIAYDFSHTAVVLGDSFFTELPDYIIEASRLSGGLSSIDQAHEVYFYRSIGKDNEARLCGNLGNQVGRRGVERVSLRNADLSILSNLIRTTAKRNDHWYANEKADGGAPDFEFLIRNEIPSSSVANYCIGNHFVIQQSPYANRGLIENVIRMPKDSQADKKLTVWELRLRDLKHRFLGQPPEKSFQIRLIRETGGYLASYPINWGWKATGGVSLKGIIYGSLSFMDALTASRGVQSGTLKKALDVLGITGLHVYKHTDLWLRSFLKEFVYDTILSLATRQSGLFEISNLSKMLDEHYSINKFHEKEVILALDLALAREIFRATL